MWRGTLVLWIGVCSFGFSIVEGQSPQKGRGKTKPGSPTISASGGSLSDSGGSTLSFGLPDDCNENGIPDANDIASGTSTDCNGDGIPDECVTCPPVEVVFVMDTSGSMSGEAAALCNAISMVEGELMALGIEATSHLLGITAAPGGSFGCLTNSVLGLLGGVVPGNGACGPLNQSESWGPATAIVAENFPWAQGAVRIIVPLSDEGACNGDPCQDPGLDRDSVTNAIAVAVANDVFVSPVAGDTSNGCTITLLEDLALGTGGVSFQSTQPDLDISQAIFDLILNACVSVTDCNNNGVPDECDIDPSDPDGDGFVSGDCNTNGVPDECDIANGDSMDVDMNGIPDECGGAPPEAFCQDLTLNADANCCALIDVASLDAGSFDPEGALLSVCITMVNGMPVNCQPSVEVCGPGTYLVELTVTDDEAQSASCEALVTVIDNSSAVVKLQAEVIPDDRGSFGIDDASFRFLGVEIDDPCGSMAVVEMTLNGIAVHANDLLRLKLDDEVEVESDSDWDLRMESPQFIFVAILEDSSGNVSVYEAALLLADFAGADLDVDEVVPGTETQRGTPIDGDAQEEFEDGIEDLLDDGFSDPAGLPSILITG